MYSPGGDVARRAPKRPGRLRWSPEVVKISRTPDLRTRAEARAERAGKVADWRRWGAIAIDVLVIGGLVTGTWFGAEALGWPRSGVISATIGAGIVLLAAWLLVRMRIGRALGETLFGLRALRRTSGLPGRPFGRGERVVDVRRGDDPVKPAVRPLHLAAGTTTESHRSAAVGATLTLDDGTTYTVPRAAIVGRDPSGIASEYAKVAVPDLSRTIHRAHVLVEPRERSLRLTDLAGDHRTAVIIDGEVHPLPKHRPVEMHYGSIIRLGARYALLSRRGEGRDERDRRRLEQARVADSSPVAAATGGELRRPRDAARRGVST